MAQIAVGRVPAGRTWVRGVASAEVLVCVTAGAAAAYFAAIGLLQYFSFHSYGWDLGLFDQVLWNTSHGRWFEYSFRDYLYLGDHFQPVLLLLAPTALLGAGPVPLLVIQGSALGGAVIPLYFAARRLGGSTSAWCVVGAYLLGLSVARALVYDFHPECFVPFLTFTSLWALVSGRTLVFVAACVGLLLLKEDMSLLVVALCWVAWLGFGHPRTAGPMAATAIAYSAVVSLVVIPHYVGVDTNPIQERYAYLGDNPAEMALSAATRPDLLIGHLLRLSSLEATFLVLAGTGFLALLVPRLLPALLLLLFEPFLAEQVAQQSLTQHYMLVPASFAMVLAVLALRSPFWNRLPLTVASDGRASAVGGGLLLACSISLFMAASPLPPSPVGDYARFNVDRHSQIAENFASMIPHHVPVSVQATYVPRLTQRRDIYEFPRVLNAGWVLVDENREVPAYDLAGFDECVEDLPSLGFTVVREADGITLWHRDWAGNRPSDCITE